MFLTLPVVAIVLIIIVLCIWSILKPSKFPPGPNWYPMVGNFFHYTKRYSALGYHHLVLEDFTKTYGPIVGLKMGKEIVVSISGAEIIKEVLTREEFNGRPDGFFFRFRTFGKRLGIVFSEGPLWQSQRKFSLQHLRTFGYGKKEMELKIIEESQEVVELLKKKSKGLVEMHNIFDIGVLNVLWMMIAGERFSLDDIRLKNLLELIHELFRLFDLSGGLLNQMPSLRYIIPEISGYSKLVTNLTRLQKFLKDTLDDHKRSHCSSHSRDLIDAFLQKMNDDADDFTFHEEQLLSLCLDLLMAGSETTSNTLSFAILYMMEYPDVQRKIQKELDDVVGRNRMPNMQDKIKLPYTEAVLLEVQRRVNVPPLGISHRATCDADLFGYTIPKGAIILTSLYSIHMDKEFWQDPLNFNPERFLDKDGNLQVPENYFMPFGYGKRSCLGISLAQTNLFIFFTAVLHNFFVQKDENNTYSLDGYDGVTISPKPFCAALVPRFD